MLQQRGETAALSFHRKDSAINVGVAERGLSAIAGAGLLVAALSFRDGHRIAAGLGGAALVARGVTGRCPLYRRLGVASGSASRVPAAGFPLLRSVTIGAERDEVRAAVRDPARWLPPELEAVSVEPTRWRIVLHLPGGRALATELESRVEEDGSLSWRSLGGGFAHQGRIFLGKAPREQGTELRIVASLRPPGARAGLLLAGPLRAAAERALGAALARLKQRVEMGEPVTAASTSARERPGRREPVRAARAREAV